MKQVILWLDGFKNPNADISYKMFFPHNYNIDMDIIWIKSFYEFKNWITINGLPACISFSYDLGDVNVVIDSYWDPLRNLQTKKEIFYSDTGLTCATWIIEYCIKKGKKLPTYNSHIFNKPASTILIKTLDSFSLIKENKLKEISKTQLN